MNDLMREWLIVATTTALPVNQPGKVSLEKWELEDIVGACIQQFVHEIYEEAKRLQGEPANLSLNEAIAVAHKKRKKEFDL
jgi:hypothetical protein